MHSITQVQERKFSVAVCALLIAYFDDKHLLSSSFRYPQQAKLLWAVEVSHRSPGALLRSYWNLYNVQTPIVTSSLSLRNSYKDRDESKSEEFFTTKIFCLHSSLQVQLIYLHVIRQRWTVSIYMTPSCTDIFFVRSFLHYINRQANLISIPLLESTIAKFPRYKWSGCFSKVIYAELDDKPWCHTSSFEKATTYKRGETSNFAAAVEGNTYMNKFE